MNRMQWLINDIQQNTDCRPLGAQMINFKLRVFPRGNVQAPTGYGKSAIIIRDIVDKVRYAMSHGKKLVITISTPLLVLNDQFYQDLVEVLVAVFPNLTAANCRFVDNSCVKSQQTGNVSGTSIPKWGMADLTAAIQKNQLVDIVFVVSTHKSYNNLLSASNGYLLAQLKNAGYQTITYFDEAHLITNGSIQSNQAGNTNGNAQLEEDVTDQIYMSQLDLDADSIYFVTATPSKWSADWFKDKKHQKVWQPNYDGFVARVTISQAIQEEAILPLDINIVEVEDNKDIATLGETVESILARPKTIKYRKVLFTCMNTAELDLLADELVNNRGIPVAITCAQHGKEIRLTNGKRVKKTMTISRFSNFIKAFPGDMVILHIRQMTAGVDCSAITTVTNRVFDNTAKNCVKMIQTNGRALRLAERGKPVSQMAKQFGEVFDIVEIKTFDTDTRFLIRFYNVIYGTTAVKVFRLVSSKMSALMRNPPVFNQVPVPIGTAPNWSAPHFYALKLIQDRMAAEKTLGQADPSLQEPILLDLLKDLDNLTPPVSLNNETDWSWYMADHALGRLWDLASLKALGLFK